MSINSNLQSFINVPGAPPIPGLTFRRFRGEGDYPLMVAILDACNIADGLEYINTVEDVASVFAHLRNCDPYQDMLFAEVNGETVSYQGFGGGRLSCVGAVCGRSLYFTALPISACR